MVSPWTHGGLSIPGGVLPFGSSRPHQTPQVSGGVTNGLPRIDLVRQRFADALLLSQNRGGYFGGQLAHRAYVRTSLVTLRNSTPVARFGVVGTKLAEAGDGLSVIAARVN